MSRTMMSLALAVAAVAAGSSANAALIAYEGFDGSPSGFDINTAAADNGDRGTATSTTLTYGDLLTGGVARQGGKAWATRARLPQYVNSGTVWVSFLYQTGAAASPWTRVLTAINGDITGSNERYNLGFTDTGFKARGVFGTSKPSATLAATLANDTTYMVVAKYDFGTAATDDGMITLWVNPDQSSLGTGAAPTGASVSTPATITDDAMAFNAIGYEGAPQPGKSPSTFDELRIGQSWIDVSPVVPEPGTAAVVAGIAMLAIGRRRH